MAETKSAAQLRDELAAAEWREYLGAKQARQAERIALYEARIAENQRVLAEAKKKLADLEAQIKSGVVGIVPKPLAGGVNVTVPAGNLGVKGN